MHRLRTIFAVLTLLVMTVLCGLSVFVLAFFDRKARLWWPISRAWAWALLHACGLQRFEVRGAERLGSGDGAILMSNHESYMDPPALMLLSPVPIRFLTKHTLFLFPVFGWAMWAMGMVPINRGRQDKAFASIDRAARDIRAGKVVLVFPEGTRVALDQPEMLPFKKGAFVMAARAHVPIIPVGIAGSRHILPKGWNWVRNHDVAVVLGEPIDTSGFDVASKDELMALVRERIEALRAEAQTVLDRS
ncbi:MAG: 1-acyl-sn-glycerol-3-phosphate acyltransferase [Deltaproteobacteria bacterium]|nr:1-acyl-sn-glycerol-3-phosphate acyltransferase [Deltaproteobacteria bacterium]